MKKKMMIFTAVILIMALGLFSLTGCSLFGPSESSIEIMDENLSFANGGSGLRLTLKIKNKHSSTIKTSFNVKIYKNDAVFDTTISGVIELAPEEIGYLDSITLIRRDIYSNYDYEITGWNFY